MQGQALIGWTNAFLATTLATAEICMKCFPHSCLRSFCRFCGQNSTFSVVFIIIDNLEWYFNIRTTKNSLKSRKTRLKRLWVNIRDLNLPPPPIVAFPNFTLDVPSSVIYNLYGFDSLLASTRYSYHSLLASCESCESNVTRNDSQVSTPYAYYHIS